MKFLAPFVAVLLSCPSALGQTPADTAAQGQLAISGTAKTSVFILPFQREGVPTLASSLISDAFTARITSHAELEVMREDDVRRLLDVESKREAVGCSRSTSCLAKVAQSMGAEFLLRGEIRLAEELYVVSVSALDTREASVYTRASVEGRSLEEAARRAQVMAEVIAADLLEEEPIEIPPLPYIRSLTDLGTLAAALGVTGMVFGSSIVTVVPLFGTAILGALFGASSALASGVGLGLYALSPVVALLAMLAAASVAALGADRAAGVQGNWYRALAAAAVGFPIYLFSMLVGGLVSVISGGLIGVAFNVEASWVAPLMLVPTTVLASAVAGVGAGATYYFSIGLFGDEPLIEGDEE